MNILGLDLSLRSTGAVILSSSKEVLLQKQLSPSTNLREVQRLLWFERELQELLTNDISLCVIEGYSMGSKGGMSFSIGELGGLARMVVHKNKTPYMVVSPNSLKKFVTGKGNAKKDQVMKDVYKRFDFDTNSNDIADAYSLAILGLYIQKLKIESSNTDFNSLPKFQQDELIKIKKSVDVVLPQKRFRT